MFTYRQVSETGFRVSFDSVEIGSVSRRTRHVRPVKTYWHWGIDTRQLIAGRTPDGDIEPPGGFEDALKAFKEAFTQWRAGVPDDKWRANLEYKRAGQERGRR